MKEKHQKKYNNGKKSRPKLANKQTKKTKSQKKGEKEVFQLTIEGAKYMLDLPACYEKKNGQNSL